MPLKHIKPDSKLALEIANYLQSSNVDLAGKSEEFKKLLVENPQAAAVQLVSEKHESDKQNEILGVVIGSLRCEQCKLEKKVENLEKTVAAYESKLQMSIRLFGAAWLILSFVLPLLLKLFGK